MARKKKAFEEKMEDLNLVPIMNLVVVLIPVVLFGMSLVKIGVVNVNAPKFGMGQAAPADDDKKPLNLTIG
jgi:biopolymer transport protein ExbD